MNQTQPHQPQNPAVKRESEGVVKELRQSTDKIRDQASEFADKARDAGKAHLQSGVDSVAAGLGAAGDSARKAADSLREQDHQSIAGYAAQAADSLASASEHLRDGSVDQLYRSVSRTARRNPVLLVAGSVVAGFALARMLKSSSDRDERRRQLRAGGGYARVEGHRG